MHIQITREYWTERIYCESSGFTCTSYFFDEINSPDDGGAICLFGEDGVANTVRTTFRNCACTNDLKPTSGGAIYSELPVAFFQLSPIR
jgi:hypothetical protein